VGEACELACDQFAAGAGAVMAPASLDGEVRGGGRRNGGSGKLTANVRWSVTRTTFGRCLRWW
jgi:hypothetical protein